jgi:hypothetical protein
MRRFGLKSSVARWVILVFVLICLLALHHRWRQSRGPLPFTQPTAPTDESQTNPNERSATRSLRDQKPLDQLTCKADELRAINRPEDGRQMLATLRRYLSSMPPEDAAAAIRNWLDTGQDAPTQLEFKVGRDGNLKETPSLRVFLLDYLTQIDPAAASSCAEKILGTMVSPDEWAISLRAYALANPSPDARIFLHQKVSEMIGNEAWRNNPSVGFLEAFDVIVYTRDRDLTPDLAQFVQQKENRALAHAAYLALDRLIQAEPAEVLGQLQSRPELMDGREGTRADLFARADVRDPKQKAVLENYLLDPGRSPTELQKFAVTYPNANYMVSYNLLTRTATPTGAELSARDREALRVVHEWLGDPRFARLGPELQAMKSRLEQFVKLPRPIQP